MNTHPFEHEPTAPSMLSIWKFPLAIKDTQKVLMPAGAEVLCVQTQHDIPCIWARVAPDVPLTPRTFLMFGTGHDVHLINMKYVGTFQIQNGALVFHVFEP